jgi:hypothetical protein
MNAARRCAAKVGFPPFGRPGIVCPRNGRRTTTTDGRIRCADGLNLSEIPGSIVQVKYLLDFFRARLCATLSIGGKRKGLPSRDGDASVPSILHDGLVALEDGLLHDPRRTPTQST